MWDLAFKERFWAKVFKTEYCWIWTASKSSRYGKIKFKGKTYLAHRISYELLVGSIPDNLVLDHVICQNKKCVNPKHLEVVTSYINNIRMNETSNFNRTRTNCKNGHPFNKENTAYLTTRPTERVCKICRKEANKRWRNSR